MCGVASVLKMMSQKIFIPCFLVILCSYGIIVRTWSLSQEYPSGSLACKIYNTSKMDCSRRSLVDIPVLDRNWTTVLDLSHNQLKKIHGAPFVNLSMLTSLDLSYNMISKLASTVFKGLYSLVKLNLCHNKLSVLSSDVFVKMHKLIYLDIGLNVVYCLPSQTLATLSSLEDLRMVYFGSTLDTVLSEFHSFIRLRALDIKGNISVTNTTFYPLAGLPIQTFQYKFILCEDCFFDKTAFVPFTSVTKLITDFRALPALESLHSPLQTLGLISWLKYPLILHNTTFQDLWKVKESLTDLKLLLPALRQIENYAFKWTPNLINLSLFTLKVETLAKYSFCGLHSLKTLNLNTNTLTAVSYGAFNIIGKFAPLTHLDLSSNSISTIADNAFAGLTSLTYLNLETYHKGIYTHFICIPWLTVLQNLKHLVIGFGRNVLDVSIDLPFPLLSLQILEIRSMDLMRFKLNLCHAFPNLRIFVTYKVLISTINVLHHLALHECSFLTKLDLSGSTIRKINAPDLKDTNISIPSLEDLTLAKNKLTSIGQILFIKAPKLVYLNISDNQIKTIDSAIAHAFKHLVHLSIDGNAIVSLSGLKHLTFLKHLNAARNQITEVPQWLISTMNEPVLITLDLSDNPFSCTCRIEKFRKWIVSDTNTWLQPGQYNCGYPETLAGRSISDIELDCRSSTWFYIGVSIPFVILFCMLIIFLIRYRWHIKYKLFLLYRNYRPFPEINEEFEMLQLQYHAYIAYNENSEDDAWVLNDLQPNMEQGPEPVRLCIKSRDFIPGHSLIESISENIQQSHNTILVLSPNFVESEWCYHEMEMAKMRLLDENLDVIVLVLLNEIPNNAITLSLRQLLCKKEYLKWPKDRAGQRLFWQRLRQELKAPVQIDRRFCM